MSEYEIGKGKPPKETQFKPGNKMGKGAPKGKRLTTILGELLKEVYTYRDIEGKEIVNEGEKGVALALIQKALLGDIKAIEVIFDRLEGKATQPVDLTQNDGIPEDELDSRILDLLNKGGKDGTVSSSEGEAQD